jgi:threonine dehydrogenase-like Zn-dependent dehydrogenase
VEALTVATVVDTLKRQLFGTPTVGVVGLGYVGLPLAVGFAESGATVMGLDLDVKRIEAVRACGVSSRTYRPRGWDALLPPGAARHGRCGGAEGCRRNRHLRADPPGQVVRHG